MINVIWPRKTNQPNSFDRFVLRAGYLPGYCVICGHHTVFRVDNPNFRDYVVCRNCQSMNRQRQIAVVLLSCHFGAAFRFFASIKDLPKEKVVWNLEVTRSLHERLSQHLGENYICSEYLSPSMSSGEMKDGVLHVDVQKTHFKDDSLDFILSGDVMEHVPFPEEALKETFRILKPGGCHIFTAPFCLHRFTTEKRVRLTDSGEEQFLLPPIYHEGAFGSKVIVYNVFAPEFLCQMEAVGFKPSLNILYSPLNGILGNNGVVMVASKPS